MKTNLLTQDFSTALTTHSEPPCLSLHQPTHRHLVEELEKSLEKKYPVEKIRSLLEPFEELERDHDFWTHTLDGIAVFAAPGLFQVYALQRPVPELVVVADSFHHLGNPEVDDVLDDLGELVLSKGGKVLVVPSAQIPTKTGAAAICRF